MNIIIIIIVILLLSLVYDRFSQKKSKEQMRIKAKKLYGKIPVRNYEYEEYEKISHYYQEKTNNKQGIDEITWNDLEMDEIFKRINSTSSSVGEEYLYDLLRRPVTDEKILTERNRVIEFFAAHEEERSEVQSSYALCGRARRIALSDYFYRFYELSPLKCGIDIIQAVFLAVVLIGMFIKPSIAIYGLVVMAIGNIISYYRKKADIESYFICMTYLMRLSELAKELYRLDIKELEDYTLPSFKAGEVFLKKKNLMKLIGDNSKLTDSLASSILEYVRMLFHIDLIAFSLLQKTIIQHEEQMKILMEKLGFLESCLAIASFRESLNYYAVAQVEQKAEGFIFAKELYHPLLTEPVPNSINANRSVLLTGSNASGKSTFLKTVAINAILAQTVCTVCAKSYQTSFFQIYSSMSLRDHLDQAESYYITEVKALKRILDHNEEEVPLLCFVDEVLRGTNTVERIAASARILKSLAKGKGICFAATHDIELTYLLKKYCDLYHFQERISDGDIHFDYLLYGGRAQSRNAIKLLEILGYEENVVEEAAQMAAYFLDKGEWKMISD